MCFVLNFAFIVLCLCLLLQCGRRTVKSETTEETAATSPATTTTAGTTEAFTPETPPRTATTTATTAATTETTIPTEKPPRKTPLQLKPSERCFCDLTRDSCDVECCCDVDCTEEDAKSFTTCVDKAPEPLDLRYCTKRDLFFASRTLFQKRPVGDLLCVVVDNVRKKDVFAEPPVISTLADVHKFVEERKHDWVMDGAKQTAKVGFKAGDALLRVEDDGSIGEWRLPTQMFSTGCEATEAVAYLQDQAFECTRSIEPLERSCVSDPALSAQTYHRGFTISSSADSKVPVHPVVCSGDSCSDLPPSAHVPSYSDEGECRNVVSRVTYKIVHNGVNGIANITARYETIALQSGVTEFVQRFGTSYAWSSGSASPDAKRSGNPGYQVGLPIPVECFKADGTACNKSRERMWMTVPEVEDGDCATLLAGGERLKFGSNLRTGCVVQLRTFKDCAVLQKVVFDYLVGESSLQTHVAMFGNSSRLNAGEHVPILRENVPSDPGGLAAASGDEGGACKLQATHVRVFVLHARTEHVSSPQNKIVSVFRRYGGATELSHLPASRHLELAFVAMFVDVSRKAVKIFAPPPTLDAHLPEDFFYPFFLNSGSGKCYRCQDRPDCRLLHFTAVALLLLALEALQQM